MKMQVAPSFTHGFNPQLLNEFEFKQPPECPVFEPTLEEFKDPIAYICKIRPIGEKTGICKIKPPPEWQPPFAVDVDKFKFVPRIQRLNELEAQSRVKLNFLDQIAKYWLLQGIPLKIPLVDKKTLDLYHLYTLVNKHGGMEKLDRERKWNIISDLMGFNSAKNLAPILRMHYVKILHPYEIFRQLKLHETKREKENSEPKVEKFKEEQTSQIVSDVDDVTVTKTEKRPVEIIELSDDEDEHSKKIKLEEMVGNDYKVHDIQDRQAIKRPKGKYLRRSGVCQPVKQPPVEDEDGSSMKTNKELQKLAFFGAGPKLPGYDPSMKVTDSKTRGRKINYNFDPLAKYACKTCGRGDQEECILLCDGCDDSYHTHCLIPPLLVIPEGDWRCPQCVALEVGKPMEAFGFEQAQKEYTLQQFGVMADTFKEQYFKSPGWDVPHKTVEKEFWRLVGCIDQDVIVQYGADLHTMDHGSGFPTSIQDDESLAMELEYSQSPWNLNNLPVCPGSVLQYIDSDISGMKVPWMYVGMCFATFCWHNEDHWNYSINYLHWGEPKTWYGVPGSYAPQLEDAMKKIAPELFQSQPDLLQQLVTIVNPNTLTDFEVPVVRTDQKAGEFVVTFPRAYHAGFNQGYNFAEAVNFATADWMKIGRECVEHYATLHRFCVFSHDELVCRIAEKPELLTPELALATYNDLIYMVKVESALRMELRSWGVTQSVKYRFEDLADDERVCEVCKTTCYLSGVTCECKNGRPRHTCLKHARELCRCPAKNHVLRYRYVMDDLLKILETLDKIVKKPRK